MNKEKNYWPHGLAVMSTIFVSFIFYTVKIAVTNQPELDNSMMLSYRDFDNNYNSIARSQQEFDKRYSVTIKSDTLKPSDNVVTLSITDKEGRPVENAQVIANVTRPDSQKFDVMLNSFKFQKDGYASMPFGVSKEGRWQINCKIKINDVVGYAHFEELAKLGS